jgi:hypothetical protein
MIPNLPPGIWSADVQLAFETIDDLVGNGLHLLAQEGVEAIRLRIAATNLDQVSTYRQSLLDSGLDEEWVSETMAVCVIIRDQLANATERSQPE